MPTALLFPLFLRIAGPVAFVIAALAAGAMNRSFLIIPLLALTATATTILIRKVSPSPVLNLQSMLNPNASGQVQNAFAGMGRRFGIGLVGYLLAFGLSALIAALFQETEFQQALTRTDIWLLLIPALAASVFAWLSARSGANQMAEMMGQMQSMFSEMQAQQGAGQPANDDDAFTVEGEVIDPDEKS
ncbi:MAG: hypothetical protein AAGB16_01305 [Pseudomonadota bacterium]